MSESQSQVQFRKSPNKSKRPLSTLVETNSKKKSSDKVTSIGSQASATSFNKISNENHITTSQESHESDSEVGSTACKETLEDVTQKTKRKSWVWQYFKEFKVTQKYSDGSLDSENRAYSQCKNCNIYYKFTGSTKRLSDHLNKKHKISEGDSNDSQLPDASKSDRDHFNFLFLMFIITSGMDFF